MRSAPIRERRGRARGLGPWIGRATSAVSEGARDVSHLPSRLAAHPRPRSLFLRALLPVRAIVSETPRKEHNTSGSATAGAPAASSSSAASTGSGASGSASSASGSPAAVSASSASGASGVSGATSASGSSGAGANPSACPTGTATAANGTAAGAAPIDATGRAAVSSAIGAAANSPPNRRSTPYVDCLCCFLINYADGHM